MLSGNNPIVAGIINTMSEATSMEDGAFKAMDLIQQPAIVEKINEGISNLMTSSTGASDTNRAANEEVYAGEDEDIPMMD